MVDGIPFHPASERKISIGNGTRQRDAWRIVIKLFRTNQTTSLSTAVVSGVLAYHPKTKRARTLTNAAMYSSALLLLAVVASAAYRPTDALMASANTGAANVVTDVTKPSVNQIAIASLAASTAEVANLSVATEASNAAITMDIKNQLAQQQDDTVITKPQTFAATDSAAITSYTTVAGDTITSVAARYGISSQTLLWANNITSDAVAPGTVLVVPTVDGVVYVVKDGDTIDSIASKYQSDKDRIISKNDLEISGITTGEQIILPGGVLPENERPGYAAPTARLGSASTASYASTAVAHSNPLYTAQAGNRYTFGTCTWYAYNRRAQLGRPIGSFWGNASSWAYAAAAAGFTVKRGNPGVGDIMQNGGGAGHVAIVENVNPDGSIRVSEMNYYANGGGWDIISYRALDAGAAAGYTFIK